MELEEVIARLNELAEPIEQRSAELAGRTDVPIGEQRAAVQALRADARFLRTLGTNLEVQSSSELSATGSVHLGMLAERMRP